MSGVSASRLAAKDAAIARLHETIWLQPWCDGCETHCRGGDDGRQWCQDDVWEKCDECGNKSVRYVLDDTLSGSPSPDPASVPPWERKAPCPCGAPIGAGCIREKEHGFRGCWLLGGPMPPAPDPAEAMRARVAKLEAAAEAMRAKCEEIARDRCQLKEVGPLWVAAKEIADAIAALKDAPQ